MNICATFKRSLINIILGTASYFLYVFPSAGMIQISNTTNMLLDMQGGFKTEERGGVEVKVSLAFKIEKI